MATQLQPLLQALDDAAGGSPNCDSALSDESEQAQPNQRQRELQLIAETLALLALADPGYGYSAPGYGYPPPGDGPPFPQPAAELATQSAVAPATLPVAAQAPEPEAPPGDVPDSAVCAPLADAPTSAGESP